MYIDPDTESVNITLMPPGAQDCFIGSVRTVGQTDKGFLGG
jgi:hypothetical protein